AWEILLVGLAFIPVTLPKSPRHITHKIFERVFRPEDRPVYMKKESQPTHTTLIYRLPYGVPYKKVEALHHLGIFEEALNKRVDMSHENGRLHITVYKENIPERVDFNGGMDWLESQGEEVPQLRQNAPHGR